MVIVCLAVCDGSNLSAPGPNGEDARPPDRGRGLVTGQVRSLASGGFDPAVLRALQRFLSALSVWNCPFDNI